MNETQKTIAIVGRIIFSGTILMLGVVTLIVGALSFKYNGETGSYPLFGKVEVDSVVLAASNGTEEGLMKVSEASSRVESEDARPLLIRRYLEKYNSPLVPYSDLIFELSETYGFPYYWIVAIGQQESNLCKKIPENSFNCWGYGIHSKGTLRFENYETALKSYAEYLKRAYFDKGLNTPELIMKKYCPSSNGSWAFGVRQFINDIESGDF